MASICENYELCFEKIEKKNEEENSHHIRLDGFDFWASLAAVQEEPVFVHPPSWLMLIPLNLSIHSFLIMADPALRVAALLESIPAALE